MAPLGSSMFNPSTILATLALSTVVHAAVTINSTILIIARDTNATSSGTSVLEGYGIPYQVVDISLKGGGIPQLNSTANAGNFGGIVAVSAREYKGGDDWKTALSDKQWQEIYQYQENFGVRLVRLDAYPSSDFGVQPAGDATSSDLPIAVTSQTEFPSANLMV
jgi:hypothetical protein